MTSEFQPFIGKHDLAVLLSCMCCVGTCAGYCYKGLQMLEPRQADPMSVKQE